MKQIKYVELTEVKQLMKSKAITYRKLSALTGISLDSLNNKLNGYVAPDANDILSICKALGLPREEIPKYFFPTA